MDARRAALEQLIDHAAVFPPASMSVADALAEDARVRATDTGWIVGRFVVRASQLPELGGANLRLSVVLDSTELDEDTRIEAIEMTDTVATDDRYPHHIHAPETYIEHPLDDEVAEWLDLCIAPTELRAKVRCGGETVPTVEELAAFIRRCRDLGVAFKATAGLHHAVRTDGEHGFLNLLAACCLGFEEAVLADEERSAFRLTPERFSWRGQGCDGDRVAQVRRDLFTSFGSCSIQEPVDDLHAMGIL